MDEGLKQIKTPEEIKEQEFEKSIQKPLTWKDLDDQKFEKESKGCPERVGGTFSGGFMVCSRKVPYEPCKKETCPYWYWRNQP